MELTCPKCHGTMRTYERNGVTVDQCTECRGIFLDRGELERLVDAENSWHGAPAAASASASSSSPSAGQRPPSGAPSVGAIVGEVLNQARASQHGHRSSGHGHPPKRKKSFLDELFG
jgi:Zn-finger nucleic acid-binding protein